VDDVRREATQENRGYKQLDHAAPFLSGIESIRPNTSSSLDLGQVLAASKQVANARAILVVA